MNVWLRCVSFVVGVVGSIVACSDDRQGGHGGDGSGNTAQSNQTPLEARRYDPTRECFWETEPIEGLYAVPGDEFTNASAGPVCLISPDGELYVAMMGTSVAVQRTESTADWKVPPWSRDNPPIYYDYSAFTSEERALCQEASLMAMAYPDAGPPETCTQETEATGGAAGEGGAGAGGKPALAGASGT
jgi:hypothetical protein